MCQVNIGKISFAEVQAFCIKLCGIMARLPQIQTTHKICIICEGAEDFAYINRLKEIAVWDQIYEFCTINAGSASNIPARYTNAFQNNSYEAVLVFCDTDKAPYREYSLIKKKLKAFHGERDAVPGKIIIFANPCTMQIVLSHFGDVLLVNQGKKTNAAVIEEFTGVKDYDAHADQIKAICSQIYHRTYPAMKERVTALNKPDTVSGSTNFIEFLSKFESPDTKWIQALNNYLTKGN